MPYVLSDIDRIGVVGQYSPENLPPSIQNELSWGLTRVSEDGSALPSLSSWWEASQSGTHYTFHLDQDKVWHDGKPIQVYDINYNIKNVTFSYADPYTLDAQLDYPYSPFPVLVSKPLFREGLIGFGPFKVKRAALNGDRIQRLELTSTDGSSKKNEIIYTFYKTESQAILAYKLGEIDHIMELTNPSPLVSWGKTDIVEQIHYDRMMILFINTSKSRLSDRSFRHALGYALPAMGNTKAISPIPKTSWAYTNNVKIFEPDTKQVDTLLEPYKEASASPTLIVSAYRTHLDLATSIAQSWIIHGIPADVRIVNSIPDDYDVFLASVSIPPDPDQYPFWHSTQANNVSNISQYVNVKIDKLLEDGRQTMDIDERKKIYADFARRLVDDAPALFLQYVKTYSVKRK